MMSCGKRGKGLAARAGRQQVPDLRRGGGASPYPAAAWAFLLRHPPITTTKRIAPAHHTRCCGVPLPLPDLSPSDMPPLSAAGWPPSAESAMSAARRDRCRSRKGARSGDITSSCSRSRSPGRVYDGTGSGGGGGGGACECVCVRVSVWGGGSQRKSGEGSGPVAGGHLHGSSKMRLVWWLHVAWPLQQG